MLAWYNQMFAAMHPYASSLMASWLLDEVSGTSAAEEQDRKGLNMRVETTQNNTQLWNKADFKRQGMGGRHCSNVSTQL